ncbi:FtsX-like permease family protein [Kribbella sp. NPDC058245]|uniref:FtsX-like permease family protein n=1 Tax=Kribbella sp. NPDC058245 TaxID=3346399 RepID=UPI0036E12B42
MSALSKVVRAGIGRRRIQTAVMMLTTMMAVTASVLAAGLLVTAKASFDESFDGQRGAHLTAQFDGTKATTAQVAATAQVPGVTADAGPYPVLSLQAHVGANHSDMPVGDRLPPMKLVGRTTTGGPVDELRITDGRWAVRIGEVVLSATNAPFGVGDVMAFPDLPGKPALTVVGLARSAGNSSEAWVSPAQLAALTVPGTTPGYQMLYRFSSAATNAEVTDHRAAISAAAPPGSMTQAASYLTIKMSADKTSATFVPFVVSFGVLGLCMSVLIIGIVVSGAVGAATRRIGILKSLGFSPEQVVRAYVGQALVPASIGTSLGVVFGNLLAIPELRDAGGALGTGTATVAPWIDLAVPAVALCAVVATATAPALRAGRLRTIEAIAVGHTPRAGRGRLIRHLLGRLPLPRAVSLGLANPFSRPSRSATMAAAVVLGTIGVTFGVGLAISLSAIQDDLNRRSPGAVVVQVAGPPAPPVPEESSRPARKADAAEIAALIRAQPGTRRYFSTGRTRVGVAGVAGETNVIAYQGDSSWGSYRLLAGSWFYKAGEAVVPSGFLTTTGTHIGDTIDLTNNGHSTQVRIVGEVFAMQQVLLTDDASLAGLGAYILPQSVQFNIDLAQGTSRQSYLGSLDAALLPYGITAQPNSAQVSSTLISMDTLAAMLTLMLVAVAGLGVLNSVVLDTRERVHDFGVFKALGMSPKQTIAMVITSVAGIGLLAGAIGVPIGIVLHNAVVPVMGQAAGTTIPNDDIAIYHLPVLVPLLLGGLVIATVGAMLPAGWAARTRTATALRTE